MPFAAALSEHPVAADAVGEVLGTVLERGGTEPDLAVLFVTPAHAGFVEEIVRAVRRVLDPRCLLGAVAGGVVGGTREIEDGPGMVLWASWSGPVRPLRLATRPVDDGIVIDAFPTDLAEGATVVLLPDAASFPADGLLQELAVRRPDLAVVGGLVPPTQQGTVLVLDDDVHHDGAVGVAIDRDQLVGPVVSQGCRPLGDPMVVTAADGHYLLELAGRPALDRLRELIAEAPPDERRRLSEGIHLGIVVDETLDAFRRGDFLVRTVLGGDEARGVLAVGDRVEVGTTVQFHVRDADAASDDLDERLAGIEGDAALLFTCNGRGAGLFGLDDHDATTLAGLTGASDVAGIFAAGELGPVGGRSFVHSFTASALIFAEI